VARELRQGTTTVKSPFQLRDSDTLDLPQICTIYAHAVRHGTGTFELEAPDVAEMAKRRAEVLGRGLPWLIAQRDGQTLGYAYANYFRPRMAYRYCLEDSIYLSPESQGQGVGTLLLTELIARCEALGARQMVAVIGDSSNAGSLNLHRRLGFTDAGLLKAAGWKFDRWLDVVFMQRELGLGAGAPA
jgi:L-amino acid N-acyltransferase YncA